ncbi:undecaprenyl/decaprenyl-phosphate alpha-N-acetylglucosaminyl 1-phosphate transferase [Parabacteroides acidifaciens]|uniref:Undecaprenyl/decaprenyl-phosphate alpha-N-acetylglucosaminyl 1-phosphate transferase n=1 Tax=Parabacteroides acidifaciens TaxID=2290935 RepID=A0A3D8HGB4_9BACT|nr:MraY family glycosyltransferase [Parabacteroides acidifaciens]MBC8601305.1 undecaprenyl/decaprenyl-phosphate alpha-N-acetylglucosaminyl 1-phosphate transferase [Parabacteroides acidifaciens]RDU49986.1 undecaprenyl/decaprenyl-phosphate alpha-N-acetylglucosaminyl 1-phosphate transferase [Parabacteroides acidifaciens]
MSYLLILLCLSVSIALSFIIIPRILVISYRKKLFDIPDERKVHNQAIPRLGGFSFLPTILFSLFFSIGIRYLVGLQLPVKSLGFIVPEFFFLICGLILLYLAGIKDDLIGLRYRSKFVIQIVAVSMLPLSGLWINNLYGLLGIHELSPWLGIPFTILATVFIINAINLIDGLDGLASGISGISLIIMGSLFFYHDMLIYAMLVFTVLGTLIPFFYYNVFGRAEHCRKIFMGDTGSLTLGYLLAFLIIRYSSCHPELMPCSGKTFTVAFTTLLIPIFDVFRVMLLRTRLHKPLFIADKNHIHHKLLSIDFSPRRSMLTILFMSGAFCVLNMTLVSYINCNVLLLVDIVLYTGINLWIDKVRDAHPSSVLSLNKKI